MFLGTGLGPRAYAIIGQGMISRIIEARPRNCACSSRRPPGVSKYKERRRETENRLADTRDNLTRVEDILRELDAQIDKLEQQAEVAQAYRDLQAEPRREAAPAVAAPQARCRRRAGKLARDIATRQTALEAHIAELRAVQRRVEELRQAHYAQSDAVHEAQGGVLTVNAEIGKLESEVRRIVDSRAALNAQIDSTRGARERRLAERSDLERPRQPAATATRRRRRSGSRPRAARSRSSRRHCRSSNRGTRRRAKRSPAPANRRRRREQAIDAAGAEQRALEREAQVLQQRRQRLDRGTRAARCARRGAAGGDAGGNAAPAGGTRRGAGALARPRRASRRCKPSASSCRKRAPPRPTPWRVSKRGCTQHRTCSPRSRPTRSSIHGCEGRAWRACRDCSASSTSNLAGKPRSRRFCGSASRPSRSAGSTRSPAWPAMRRPRGSRSIRLRAPRVAKRQHWRASRSWPSACADTTRPSPASSPIGSRRCTSRRTCSRRSPPARSCRPAGSSSSAAAIWCRATPCGSSLRTIARPACWRGVRRSKISSASCAPTSCLPRRRSTT